MDLAALIRAWCVLQDCIRVMRGLPLPGQYRPEADPAKLMKQLKSAMKKSPIDVSAIKTFNAPTEDEPTTAADQPPTEKPAKVEPTKKESLSHDAGVTAG